MKPTKRQIAECVLREYFGPLPGFAYEESANDHVNVLRRNAREAAERVADNILRLINDNR